MAPLPLSDSPVEARRAPRRGDHGEATLQALAGCTPEETKALREKGIIGVPRG